MRKTNSGFRFFAARLGLWLMLACLCAGVFMLPGCAKAGASYTETDWMKYLPDDMPISEINMPGTHDSGTAHISMQNYSCCQDKDIIDQMKIGMRIFDIRLGKKADEKPKDALSLILYHSSLPCSKGSATGPDLRLRDCVEWAQSFLKDHPSETIVFNVCAEVNKADTVLYIKQFFYDYSYENRTQDQFILAFETNEKVPCLGDVRGKLVVMHDTNGDYPRSYTRYEMEYELDKDLNGKMSNKVDRIDRIFTTAVRSAWRIDYTGLDKNQWPSFRDEGKYNTPGREANSDIKYIGTNVTNKAGDPPHWFGSGPRACAKEFYSYNRINLVTRERGFHYGWFTMDFPEMCPFFTKQIILSNYKYLQDYIVKIEAPKGIIPDAVLYRVDSDGTRHKLNAKQTQNESGSDINVYTYTVLAQPRYETKSNTEFQYEADITTNDSVHATVYLKERYKHSVTYDYMNDIGADRVWEETYTVTTDVKPVNAEVTVYWDNSADKDMRPRDGELNKYLNLIGGTLRFTAIDSKGGSHIISVPGDGPSISKYSASEYTNQSRIQVLNLPTDDGLGGKLTYTGMELPAESGLYKITASKVRYKDEYEIHMQYIYPSGVQGVPVPMLWCDGNNKYGTRDAAINDLIEHYDFVNNHSPVRSLVDVKFTDNGEKLVYTVDDRNGGVPIKKHTIREPKPEKDDNLKVKYYEYATRGLSYEEEHYKSTIIGEGDHELISFNMGLLLGTCDVTVTWVGDSPDERPNGITVYLAGDSGTSVNLYPGGDQWHNTGVYQVFNRKNVETCYEDEGVSVNIPDGYLFSYSAKRSPLEVGQIPHYDINIVMRKEGYADVQGDVVWHDGRTSPSHPNPFTTILNRYKRDPAGGTDPDNMIEEEINVEEAGIRWDWTRPGHYYFEEENLKKYFPRYSETGSECRYSIYVEGVENYLPEADGLDMVLTRLITVSGTADWEGGNRPANTQPEVQVMRAHDPATGMSGIEPCGDPVTCEDFKYSVSGLPIADENNNPYEYSIIAKVPGFNESIYTVKYPAPFVDTATGNVKANAVFRKTEPDMMAQVPVVVYQDGGGTLAETDSCRIVIDGTLPDGHYQSWTDLNSENGFEYVFYLNCTGMQLNTPYTFQVYQIPTSKPYWQYDQTVKDVSVTVSQLNGMQPVITVNFADPDDEADRAVRFFNKYQPVSGLVNIVLEKQIDNLVEEYVSAPAEMFAFEMEQETEDGRKTVGKVMRTGEGKVKFPEVYLHKAGEYIFHVTEVSFPSTAGWEYDYADYPVKVVVTDVNGFLKATADSVPLITNVYENEYYDIGVRIQWQGESKKWPIPKSVNVKLYSDGANAGEAEVDKNTNWFCEFPEMPGYSKLMSLAKSSIMPVKPIDYTIIADEVPGYMQTITGNAKTGFVIVYASVPPKTGDDAQLALWFLLLGGAMITMTCMTRIARRKRG